MGSAALRILFLGPLPPPVNGHALAAKVFLDALKKRHTVDVVDLSVDSAGNGSLSVGRIAAVLKVLWDVRRKRRNQDAIYLTISESVMGNFKDLLIYWLCRHNLSRMVIHLHGGTIKSELFDRRPWIRSINAACIRRMAGVIISGKSHENVFADMIDQRRVHISVNFAQDEMFVAEPTIHRKFAAISPLRLLFISNMLLMKGYDELADAYIGLEPTLKARLLLDFAGRFDTEANERKFLSKIAAIEGIAYHGVVDGAKKQELFANAHVFCLPSAFKEGQPISILEAYASGCVVVTTGQPGIRDVFEPGLNGFEVEPRSVMSLRSTLARLAQYDAGELERIALGNSRTARERYRTTSYNARLTSIVEGVPNVAASG